MVYFENHLENCDGNDKAPSDHKKKANNIPALKHAAKAVIEEFFAEDGLVYADLELSATPTSSHPTSPSSTS